MSFLIIFCIRTRSHDWYGSYNFYHSHCIRSPHPAGFLQNSSNRSRDRNNMHFHLYYFRPIRQSRPER